MICGSGFLVLLVVNLVYICSAFLLFRAQISILGFLLFLME